MRGASLKLRGSSLELRGASLELLGASLELLGASLELRWSSLDAFDVITTRCASTWHAADTRGAHTDHSHNPTDRQTTDEAITPRSKMGCQDQSK